jgi:hypothetical protein
LVRVDQDVEVGVFNGNGGNGAKPIHRTRGLLKTKPRKTRHTTILKRTNK